MRYFKSRTEAGSLLATQIGDTYSRENTAVVALDSGGLVVGAEIAKSLHSSLYLLPVSTVLLSDQAEALSQMTTTSAFSAILNSARFNIEEATQSSEFILNRLQIDNFLKDSPILGKEGAFNKALLARHTIIVVSDGIANGLSIALADSFFKPIATKNIIVAAPICSSGLTERVHDMTREFFYLESFQSEYPISHYYESRDIPTGEEAFEIMSTISVNW